MLRGNISPHTGRFLCCNSLFQLLYIRIVSSFALNFWKLFLAQYKRPDISTFHHKLHLVVFSPILSVNSSENWLSALEKMYFKKQDITTVRKLFIGKKLHSWAKAKQQYLIVRQWREKRRCTIKLKSKWNTLRGIVNTDLCNGPHKFTAHKSK